MTNAYIITTNNLCKNYGVGDNAVRALKNCSIEIHTGESVAVTGASGSGKSTFLTLVWQVVIRQRPVVQVMSTRRQ